MKMLVQCGVGSMMFTSKAFGRLMFGIIVVLTNFWQPHLFTDITILPQWYAYAAGALVWATVYFICAKRVELKISRFSLALGILLSYLFVHSLIDGGMNSSLLTIPCFACLVIIFGSSCNEDFEAYKRMIIIVTLLHALYGILQYQHFVPNNTLFTLVGRFDNPAGFAACMVAGFPFCLCLQGRGSLRKVLKIIAAIVILTAIVMSGSRAGILCAVGLIFVWCLHWFVRADSRKKTIVAGIVMVVGLTAFLALGFKQGSTMGRLSIWKNTLDMFEDAPVLGHGAGSFKADYMHYQAAANANDPENMYADLADNIAHPLNEYLLLAAEHGLVGVLLLAVIIVSVGRRRQFSPFLLSLAGIGGFALFSYPLQYGYILVVMAMCCGYLAKEAEPGHAIRTSKTSRAAMAVVSAGLLCLLAMDISFEYRWARVAWIARHHAERALKEYSKLHDSWNGDPLFLYNYAAYLNKQKQYGKSNLVFSECGKYFDDYDVQMLMGQNHSKLEEWPAAEKAFVEAHYMIPNRFMPLYRLVELYDRTGRTIQADSIATMILNKPVKVPSARIDGIVGEIRARKFSH